MLFRSLLVHRGHLAREVPAVHEEGQELDVGRGAHHGMVADRDPGRLVSGGRPRGEAPLPVKSLEQGFRK